MATDKTNEHGTETERSSSPQFAASSLVDALADGFRAEATRLINLGLKQDSPDHRIAGLVVDAIGKAVARTYESASTVVLSDRP